MKNSVYRYDAEKHHYYIDEKRVPGVTGILRGCGYIQYPPHIDMSDAQYRGNYVHAACHLLNRKDLDWTTIKPEFMVYIKAYAQFLDENKAEVIETELPVFSPIWGYAGTLDVILKINGEVGLWDIKTSKQPQKYWKYQTAAYKLAYEEMTGRRLRIKSRNTVRLAPDGTFPIETYRNDRDEKRWLTILADYQIKLSDRLVSMEEEDNE